MPTSPDETLPGPGTSTDTGDSGTTPDVGLKARYDFQEDSDGLINTDWSKIGVDNSATVRTTQTQNIGQVQEAFTNMPGAEQQSIFPPSFTQVDAQTYDELEADDIPYDKLGPSDKFSGQIDLPQNSSDYDSADTFTDKAARRFQSIGADTGRILGFLASPAGLAFITKQVTLQLQNRYGFTKAFNPLAIVGSIAESISVERHFNTPGIQAYQGDNIVSSAIGTISQTATAMASAAVSQAVTGPMKFTTSPQFNILTNSGKAKDITHGANQSFNLHERNYHSAGIIGDIADAASNFIASLQGQVPLDGKRIERDGNFFHENWNGAIKSSDDYKLWGNGVHNTLQVPYGGKFGNDKVALLYGTNNTFTGIGDQNSTTGVYKDFIKFRIRDVINGKWLIFPAHLGNLTDNVNAEYQQDRYIGRPDAVHIYSGTNRNISFDFRVAAFTKQEIPLIQEKMNYLVGLCYPTFRSNFSDDKEKRPLSPYITLTIGDMFYNTPGYFSNITVTVEENVTWETDDSFQIPQVFTVTCEFVYVGKHLPQMTGKHYEVPWLKNYSLQGGFGTFKHDPMAHDRAPEGGMATDFSVLQPDADISSNYTPDNNFTNQTAKKIGEARRKATIQHSLSNLPDIDEAAIKKAKEAANNDGTGLGEKFLKENSDKFNEQMKQGLKLRNMDAASPGGQGATGGLGIV